MKLFALKGKKKERELQTRTNTQKFSPNDNQVGNLKAHRNKWHIVSHLAKLIIGIHYICLGPNSAKYLSMCPALSKRRLQSLRVQSRAEVRHLLKYFPDAGP